MTMRIIERYEDGLRIEAGFYDDANAGAGLPPLSRTERAVSPSARSPPSGPWSLSAAS